MRLNGAVSNGFRGENSPFGRDWGCVRGVFGNGTGGVFHRETPGVSRVKRLLDQIEMGGGGLFFFHFFLDEPFC